MRLRDCAGSGAGTAGAGAAHRRVEIGRAPGGGGSGRVPRHRGPPGNHQQHGCAYEIALGLAPGPLEPVPLTEESPLRTTLHPYRNRPAGSIPFDWVTPDYDKILVERVVRSEPSLAATILRLPMVYGPGDPLHRF